MGFANYLKGAIWDFVLTALSAVSMSYLILNCFYVDSAVQAGPVPGVVSGVLVAVLFLLAYSKKTIRWGIPAYIALIVIIGVIGGSMTPADALWSDVEGNWFILLLVVSLTPTVVFLLTRRLGLTAILFIVSAFMVAVIQFLYLHGDYVWSILAVLSGLMLVVYKNYQKSMREATSLKTLSFLPGFAAAVGTGLVSVGLACAVWFGIIEPLNPPAADIKLVTEYRALETVPVHGTLSEYQVPDTSLTSDQTNDLSRTTDQYFEDPDGIKYPANTDPSNDDGSADDEQDPEDAEEDYDDQDPDPTFDIRDFLDQISLVLPIIIAVIVLLIVGFFVGRRIYRRRRLERLRSKSPREQILWLYPFLVSRLAKMGFAVPQGQTPSEYAAHNHASMEVFDQEAGVSFEDLTAVYAGTVYSDSQPEQSAADPFGAYYSAFWRAARKKIGSVKYFFKSFRL